MINEVDNLPRRQIQVAGHSMSLVDVGDGPPVYFLHGNVTYSYTWRNIIPFVSMRYRCLAPDRIGMGDSELEFPSGSGSYRFDDQVESFELLVELTEPERPIVLVGHEMGAAAAIHYARRNPHRVASLVLIEGVFRVTNDTTFDADVRDMLLRVRSEEGEHLVLEENVLVERYLPRLTLRVLTATEMDNYRRPFTKPGEPRRALLSTVRQLPLQSTPGPIDMLVEDNRLWCAQTTIPKFVVGGVPGFLVPPAVLGTAARWRKAEVASVPGLHFLTEDSPARITALLIDWLDAIGF
ncbi:MAG TPA: haloalkane dehalogenase [Acidimicrobiia bacterium]|nr:haloalkane dehalogenase [Acidimicrobiia bacterium]